MRCLPPHSPASALFAIAFATTRARPAHRAATAAAAPASGRRFPAATAAPHAVFGPPASAIARRTVPPPPPALSPVRELRADPRSPHTPLQTPCDLNALTGKRRAAIKFDAAQGQFLEREFLSMQKRQPAEVRDDLILGPWWQGQMAAADVDKRQLYQRTRGWFSALCSQSQGRARCCRQRQWSWARAWTRTRARARAWTWP